MVTSIRATFFGLSILALVVTSPLSAQHLQTREGFWGNLGMGWGSLGCEDCDGREGGISGNLMLGGTISQKVLLGGMSAGWTKEEQGVTLTVGSLAAVIRFYPSAEGGFFLLGGLGIGTIEARVAGWGSERETGSSAVIGLGYDIRVGPNLSLTPFWNGVAVASSNSDANFGQIGIGITIH